MALLSPLNEHTRLEVTREGGFAYIPALHTRQRVAWCDLSLAQRERVCALINPLASQTQTPPSGHGETVGHADQRYYRIMILTQTEGDPPQFELVVPESSAPPELAALWKNGRLD